VGHGDPPPALLPCGAHPGRVAMSSESSPRPIDPARFDERKRQVARRLRYICPDIQDEELARVVDRITLSELRHESGQLGFTHADLDAELRRWPPGAAR
jgi:hypothetical protein